MLQVLLLISASWLGPTAKQPPLRPPSRSQLLTMQERVWLNEGGERVVKKGKKKVEKDPDDPANEERRLLLLGLIASPTLLIGGKIFKDVTSAPERRAAAIRRSSSAVGLLGDDGDAVTSPSLEIKFVDAVVDNPYEGSLKDAAALIPYLEERGGTQLAAAGLNGRWVLPWVGGWERIYAASADSSYMGGPKEKSFRARGDFFTQISARHFVYGPGEGGITIEYLHAAGTGDQKLLLTRPGAVTNLGSNTFQLDFSTPLEEFEVRQDAKGDDKLATGEALVGGEERATKINSMILRTTYLSERLWIVRDLTDGDKLSVFQRTSTRSVMDRRGLVAEGQLKPSSDESIRYGRLLFGDTAEDYQGWKAKAEEGMSERDKLLGR